MHQMASISASMLNDEGGREKNGMYQLWGGSHGIQEGEECMNGGGGGGGGGSKRGYRGRGRSNFVYVSTRYRWACNMQMHIHIYT